MAELKLINPADFEPSGVEKVIATGGGLASYLSIFGTLVEFGVIAYRMIKNRSLMSGKAFASSTRILFVRDTGERKDIPVNEISRMEFHYYGLSAGNLGLYQQIEDGAHPCTTFTVFTDEDSYTGNTLEGKKACRKFLRQCYDAGIPIKEYAQHCRTYLLKVRMYAEIEELKKQYGEDFW